MQVTVAIENGQDRGLYEVPIVDDHRRIESQGQETEGGGHRVAHQVPVTIRPIVGRAIGLHDETIADDEVDRAHAADRHLSLHRDAEEMEPKAEQGLEAGVRIAPSEVDQPALPAGKCTAQGRTLRA